MNRVLSSGFICSLLLVLLAGSCMAEETPHYLAYVQGGIGSVSNTNDGGMLISIQNPIPFFNVANAGKNHLIPLERLGNLTFPLQAAMVATASGNETVSLLTVTDLNLSDQVLTFAVTPLPFYDGSLLEAFAARVSGPDISVNGTSTGIYLDIAGRVPENSDIDLCDFEPWNCGK